MEPLRRRPGFTLVEVLLALTLSSLIGLAVLLMVSGLASATTTQVDTRRSGVKRQVVAVRLGTLVRTAARVLGTSPRCVVLWRGDANGNHAPDLSELRLIAWEAASTEVRVYEAPADLDPLDDVSYDWSEDFVSVAEGLAASGDLVSRTTLQGVEGWEVVIDRPEAQAARCVRIDVQLVVESGGSEAASVIVCLRASG